MTFPSLIPTSRAYDAGDFPVKAYKAQNGSEVRYLYGNKRTGMQLQLSYENIPDSSAQQFLDHFQQTYGTYETFLLGDNFNTAVAGGWGGSPGALSAALYGNQWRYAEPPTVTAVYPGISTVTVKLVGVFS
jgi:hypothetical protein